MYQQFFTMLLVFLGAFSCLACDESHTPVAHNAPISFEFRLVEPNSGTEWIEAREPDTARTIYLHKEPLLTNVDIADITMSRDQFGKPSVLLRISDSAQSKLRNATDKHIGKEAAVLLDGKIHIVYTIQTRLSSTVAITGNFTQAEAEQLAKALIQ